MVAFTTHVDKVPQKAFEHIPGYFRPGQSKGPMLFKKRHKKQRLAEKKKKIAAAAAGKVK